MITNFLLDHAALVPLALALGVLTCLAVGYATLRRGRYGTRAAWALAALSALPLLALTLVPASPSGGNQVACTVQFALPTLTRVELLANVALFVPLVFFATLATRRPLVVLAVGSAASAGLEALQALLPAIGRACDTNDWFMNTLGVLVGVLLARGTMAFVDRTAAPRDDPR